MSDFPGRLANDCRKSREKSCLSNESTNFKAFEKSHQNWRFKRICMPQLISAQKFLPFLLEKSFISETVSALYLHSFRKHKMNDYLFHNLISFPSSFQNDFNLENVKHSATRQPAVFILFIYA